MIVAVVGKGRNCPIAVRDTSREVGGIVGRLGHVLVTGGLEGVMLHAAFGAHAAGGTVLGLIPEGRDPDPRFPGIALRTGLSPWTRNVVMGACCDRMLVCSGSHGAMQEIAVALDRDVPIAGVGALPAQLSIMVATQLELEEVEGWLTSVS